MSDLQPFIYGAGVFVVLAFGIAAMLIHRTPESDDMETRKLRFAAVMFTGILILFVFVSVLYFAAGPSAGRQTAAKEIFEKAVTAMTPLAGVIMGYIFQTPKKRTEPKKREEEITAPEKTSKQGRARRHGAGGKTPPLAAKRMPAAS